MSEDNNIPKHWGRTKASEVGKLLRGINYKKQDASNEAKKDFLPVLRGNNINGELNFEDLVFVPKQNVSNEQLIKAGDIVFAMSSGSKHLVGKSAKAKTDYNGSFGAFCGVFRPNENFDKNFVAYFFQSPYYKKVISEISKGTNINNLKREHILDLDFPIPPLPEQQAIVAKIEELLSDLENGKQQLQTAQQQLKVYRQSLLKWAFEGLKEEKTIEEISEDHSIGLVRSSKDQNDIQKGVPYIKMNNVDLDGNVDFKKVVYVEVIPEEAKKYSLKKGDILINTRNSIELVGKTGVVREEKPNCVFNNNLLRIRTKQEYNSLFIGYQLIGPWLRKQMTREKKSTTNVCALYQRDIFPLKIKVANSKEQQLIVDELESKLTICDKLEETISHSLQQAETLRQSILKKAFEGKLVTQNPNDEPASKLLEKIKAESAKAR